MNKTYIIPVLNITKLCVESMIALSGPQTSSVSANQEAGMDVKSTRQDYNVWNDDWSK